MSTEPSILKVMKQFCSSKDDQTVSKSLFRYLQSIFLKDLELCFNKAGLIFIILNDDEEGQGLYLIGGLLKNDDSRFDNYKGFESLVYDRRNENKCWDDIDKFLDDLQKMQDDSDFKKDAFAFAELLNRYNFNRSFLFTYRMNLYKVFNSIAKSKGASSMKVDKVLENILIMSCDHTSLDIKDKTNMQWENANTENNGNKEKLGEKKINIRSSFEKPNTSSLTELDTLIGLQSVKEEVRSLSNFIAMRKKREEMNLPVPKVSYHCVFTGNPGTGKTTVARIMAGIFKEKGILSKGHLVETDRSGLVAEYLGQTAVKTNKIIDSALDGVLFIDEAYSLVAKEDSYGQEAISTLLKRMEDDRDRLIVILAGYTKEMETFINSNPGLRSRFNRYIDFPDYNAQELLEIFLRNVNKNQYTITEDAKSAIKKKLETVLSKKPRDFGNARYVRNLFEKIVEAQANRVASLPYVSREILAEIQLSDIPI